MAYPGATSDGGAAAYGAIAQAIKASGAIVKVEPEYFLQILKKESLVVLCKGGLIKANFQYLTGYKGLVFFTKSTTPLALPGDVELITAKQIWVPY
jgi:hypothetical protein